MFAPKPQNDSRMIRGAKPEPAAGADTGFGRAQQPMKTIVVIDDSDSNIKIFSKLSEVACPDAIVKAFSNPLVALKWLEEREASLIIADYQMPGMTGAELTRQVRLRPLCAEVPVIVVTAYHDRNFRVEALEAGATDFLLSPIDFNEFQVRVRNLLKLSSRQIVVRERARILEQELLQSRYLRDQALRDSHAQLSQVIDTMPALISAIDRNGDSIFSNAYQAQLLGASWRRDIDERDHLVFNSGEAVASYEEQITDQSGQERTFLTTKSPLRSPDGGVMAVLTTSLDISDRKRAEKERLYLAEHDQLTALPNRYYLNHWLTREIDEVGATKRPFALYYIDLDRFKHINDGLGHHFGDQLLQEVGKRLQHAVGNNDVVARLGADEFAILQLGVKSLEDAIPFAEHIKLLLKEPFLIDGQEITTSASIGVTTYPWDGKNAQELLRNADLAMYRVKARGRDGTESYTQTMFSEVRNEIRLRDQLRGALERGEFILHYQPQFDLKAGAIVGAEALVRWAPVQGTLIGPDVFIPLAEECDMMRSIDAWVLREACHQAKLWSEAYSRPIRIAINLSTQTFRSPNLSATIMDALKKEGLLPTLLELELTEEVLLGTGRVYREIETLRRRGVRLAIDDFGTGYSSFARLSSLPVDIIKIDRSFIANSADKNNVAIIKAIVGLGRALGVEILAEGAETASQFELVKEVGCDLVQGFFTGRPMEVTQFHNVIAQNQSMRLTAGGDMLHKAVGSEAGKPINV
jgi:diguanylate cyclase (GGDEF)-like protein/PAS domain S-box-containing protein